jgi:hypothetical protein
MHGVALGAFYDWIEPAAELIRFDFAHDLIGKVSGFSDHALFCA